MIGFSRESKLPRPWEGWPDYTTRQGLAVIKISRAYGRKKGEGQGSSHKDRLKPLSRPVYPCLTPSSGLMRPWGWAWGACKCASLHARDNSKSRDRRTRREGVAVTAEAGLETPERDSRKRDRACHAEHSPRSKTDGSGCTHRFISRHEDGTLAAAAWYCWQLRATWSALSPPTSPVGVTRASAASRLCHGAGRSQEPGPRRREKGLVAG